jgi:GntR family histidine utilization transcriptional repressor
VRAREVVGWQQIRDELRRRIRDREWLPGAAIPSEVDLAREFGVARATMHRALRELADAGTLERRRRLGTRVAMHPVRQARFGIPLLRREIEDAGAVYGYRLVSREVRVAPTTVSEALGIPHRAVLTHVRAVHSADGRPYVLEDRWVHARRVPGFATADLASISANEWLLANVPVTTGEMTLTAERAGSEAARLLECQPSEPVVTVRRVTWRDGAGITQVRLVYAPGHALVSAIGVDP